MHPFWKLPIGSNENKSAIAEEILDDMLANAVWRNVIWLHEGVAVYEVRNAKAYGMRWTLEVSKTTQTNEGGEHVADETKKAVAGQGGDESRKTWRIQNTTFRGFLEPIEGLDHELDRVQPPK